MFVRTSVARNVMPLIDGFRKEVINSLPACERRSEYRADHTCDHVELRITIGGRRLRNEAASS